MAICSTPKRGTTGTDSWSRTEYRPATWPLRTRQGRLPRRIMRAARGPHAEARSEPLHAGRSTIVVQTDIIDGSGRLAVRVIQSQALLHPRQPPAVSESRALKYELLGRLQAGSKDLRTGALT